MNNTEDVKKLFEKRIKEFAEENKVKPTDITILIQRVKDDKRDEVVFAEYVRRNGVTEFNRELSVASQIINPPFGFDFANAGAKLRLALDYIAGGLREELMHVNGACSIYEVVVMVYATANDPIRIKLEMYKDGEDTKGRREVTWEQLADLF